MKYLNYYEDSDEVPEHFYFFGVLGSVSPKYLEHLIKGANRAR